MPYTNVRAAQYPAAARHDVDDAPRLEGAAEPAGDRVSVGGRPLEGRAGPAARGIRIDGRHADVHRGSRPVCRDVPRRLAAARRTGDRPDPPRLAPRDATGLAALGDPGGSRSGHWHRHAHRRGVRFRLEHHPDLRLQGRRRAQRRPSRLRLHHAVAAGLRRRHHRVRQPHVHELGPHGESCCRSSVEDRRSRAQDRRSRRLPSLARGTTSRASSPAGTTRWPIG